MKKKIRKKKIILLGGSGFIGLHLAKRISEIGWDTTILSKDTQKISKLGFSESLTLIKGDITRYEDVLTGIKGKDCIVNLAAVCNTSSKFDPYSDLEVNCRGQLNVLESRKNSNPNSKYIFLGSRMQFGIVREDDMPIKDEHCQNPISLYGIHKTTAENYCKLYKRAFNLNSIVLRLPIVYGFNLIGDNKNNIIPHLVKKAINNEKFYINGYGSDIKDLLYVDDIIDLILLVIDSKVKNGAFNVGSGQKIRFIDLAEKIIKLLNSGSYEAVPFPKELAKFELGSFYFDTSGLKKIFKWMPKTSLDDGLIKIMDFFKNSVRSG